MYKCRHLIENFFCKLKEFKRIAMGADKTDQSFKACIYLAAAVINSRSISTNPRLSPTQFRPIEHRRSNRPSPSDSNLRDDNPDYALTRMYTRSGSRSGCAADRCDCARPAVSRNRAEYWHHPHCRDQVDRGKGPEGLCREMMPVRRFRKCISLPWRCIRPRHPHCHCASQQRCAARRAPRGCRVCAPPRSCVAAFVQPLPAAARPRDAGRSTGRRRRALASPRIPIAYH